MRLRGDHARISYVYGFIGGALLFGSLWGMLEATLGGALHLLHVPYKGQIMANIGFFIMAAAVTATGHSFLPLAMGLVAGSFKVADTFLLSVPLAERMIVNPMIAIVLEACAFQGLYLIVLRKGHTLRDIFVNPSRRQVSSVSLLLGSAGMFIATAVSAGVFFFVLRRGPWSVGRTGQIIRYLAVDGTIGAATAAAVVPIGVLVGLKAGERGVRMHERRPGFTRAVEGVVICSCWCASVLWTLMV